MQSNRPHVQSLPSVALDQQSRAPLDQRRHEEVGMKNRRNGYPTNRGGHAGKGARGRPKKREREDEEILDVAKQWADKLPGTSPRSENDISTRRFA